MLLVQLCVVEGIVVELGVRVDGIDSRRSLARGGRSLRWSSISTSIGFLAG